MIASTFSLVDQLAHPADTVWVESDGSSNTRYSTLIVPICFGNSAALFFCGMPHHAVGPVADEITPIFICAVAAQGRGGQEQEHGSAERLHDIHASLLKMNN